MTLSEATTSASSPDALDLAAAVQYKVDKGDENVKILGVHRDGDQGGLERHRTPDDTVHSLTEEPGHLT